MVASPADPILLSLFANRFMSVAEAMGVALQKTSVSTNIKERLDFSCALFAPNGDLIANAPHLPVHLGSMSFAVKFQIEHLGIGPDAPSGNGIEEGDVILTNAPKAGGSHLPDVTIITPVFDKVTKELIFFTASRGHHADVGGILPGSMPPTSTTIFEEGAQVTSFKIVKKGKFDQAGLVRHFVDIPASYTGSSGTRCFRDVNSDLQAQIAANNKGIQLIDAMIQEYTLETTLAYMTHIRNNAELSVRNLLREVAARHSSPEAILHRIEYMDDGTPIELNVTINAESGSAVFDFTGTGPEMWGSLNAPISICYSAVIYCLRAMVNQDIPLNAGCLAPITLIIPPNSLLNPSETCAVVGGNVTTSMRIVDVVLGAFKSAAASGGCCNNLTFGTASWGMYETIASGAGAGADWDGESGVHTHMTNTRITDPEVLERRYPVLLHEFSIRDGSGGDGLYRGGDGVVRDIEFLEPIQASILSERRVHRPYGMAGGQPAKSGQNLWIKKTRKEDGDWKSENDPARIISIGGRATVKMGAGDHIKILTPGGGGWGAAGEKRAPKVGATRQVFVPRGSLVDRQASQLGV
ncbi:Hydantoinase B/oxoprolinase [Leucosporidium creatinivorum]|uniref:Hydantoinase B/oxoprolinase n=1 Tax=Leucosporidium creatinivorum TaxID=106004 RepID=A0A1Y2F3I6_9BASI|nr:Hydantoinase B/oxoprolinase [Leucosporidium creatinivorum]